MIWLQQPLRQPPLKLSVSLIGSHAITLSYLPSPTVLHAAFHAPPPSFPPEHHISPPSSYLVSFPWYLKYLPFGRIGLNMMADAPAVVKYFLRKLSGCKGLTGKSYDRSLRTWCCLCSRMMEGPNFSDLPHTYAHGVALYCDLLIFQSSLLTLGTAVFCNDNYTKTEDWVY